MGSVTRQIDIINHVISGKREAIPSNCPPVYSQIIRQCWANLPKERPEMSWVLDRLKLLKPQANEYEEQFGKAYDLKLAEKFKPIKTEEEKSDKEREGRKRRDRTTLLTGAKGTRKRSTHSRIPPSEHVSLQVLCLESVPLYTETKWKAQRDEFFGTELKHSMAPARIQAVGLKAAAHGRGFDGPSKQQKLALLRQNARGRSHSTNCASFRSAIPNSFQTYPTPKIVTPRLIRFSNRSGSITAGIVRQLSYKAMFARETYLLDQGNAFLQWNSPKSTRLQWDKSSEVFHAMRRSGSEGNRIVISAEKQSTAGYAKAVEIFWTKLGSVPPTDWVMPETRPIASKPETIHWWRFQRDPMTGSGLLIPQLTAPTYRNLDRNSVLVFDIGFELIAFMGINSSPQARYWIYDIVLSLLKGRKREKYSVSFVFYGCKHPLLDAFVKPRFLWKPSRPLVKK